MEFSSTDICTNSVCVVSPCNLLVLFLAIEFEKSFQFNMLPNLPNSDILHKSLDTSFRISSTSVIL